MTMATSTGSSKGYLAFALGMGMAGISAAQTNDAFLARPYGWLPPITSYSKGKVSSLSTTRVAPSLTANEMISKLKEEGLPVAAIAEITGVERKTIYAWLAGGAIRPHNHDRIESIFRLLQEEKQADLRSLYRFWNRKFNDGSSLSMALQHDVLDKESIRAKLAELWPLAKKQQVANRGQTTSSGLKNNPYLRESREVGLTLDA